MGNRWGTAGPPPEAYSRVTDAERFRPLHRLGLSVLADLEEHFTVTRSSVPARADHHLSSGGIALTPADPAAAPFIMYFTSVPGMELHMGATVTVALPTCGCDACDEDVDECVQHMAPWIAALVDGDITERIRRRGRHGWWLEVSTNARPGSGSGALVEGAQAVHLRRALPNGDQRWAPWPTRQAASGTPTWLWEPEGFGQEKGDHRGG